MNTGAARRRRLPREHPLLAPLIIAVIGLVLLGSGLTAEYHNATTRLDDVSITFVVKPGEKVTDTDRRIATWARTLSLVYSLHGKERGASWRWSIDVDGHQATLLESPSSLMMRRVAPYRWEPDGPVVLLAGGLALVLGALFVAAARWRDRPARGGRSPQSRADLVRPIHPSATAEPYPRTGRSAPGTPP